MIIDLNRTAAFMCSYCNQTTIKKISAFDIAKKKPLKISCDSMLCGDSGMSISQKGDLYNVKLNCPCCLEVHNYKLSFSKLFKEPVVVFKCPAENEEIAAVGIKEKVEELLEEVEEEADSPGFDILYEIVDTLNDFGKQKLIKCKCGSTNIAFDIRENMIVLGCTECKKTRIMEINEQTLMMLMNSDAVYIR